MILVSIYFSYKQHFNQLRGLKTEIEHLQHLLERSKVKLLKDFEIWWAEQAVIAQVSPPFISSGMIDTYYSSQSNDFDNIL